MKFGVWILGCWIFDFFVWKRGQGVYIVFTDGFLLFFSGQGGVNHFRPLDPTMTNDQYAAQLDFQTMFFGVVFFNMFCG